MVSGLSDIEELFNHSTEFETCCMPVSTTSLFSNFHGPLFQEFRILLGTSPMILGPSVSQMMPLLPLDTKKELQKASVDIVILNQIMFLLMNNFASSDYSTFDAIFEQVKHFSVSQLEDILDEIPYPYTAALQQSILTIAIKSNVPAIVSLLLKRGLDANRVTCLFEGSSFTPLGLACKFRRVEIVEILVRKGADHSCQPTASATWYLIGSEYNENDKEAKLPSVTGKILRCLLIAGARMGWLELENSLFWANKSLVDIYVRYSKYPTVFKRGFQIHRPLVNAMHFCDPDQASAAIQTMLGHDFCIINEEATDPQIQEQCLEALARASYQGNTSLVEYFLGIGLVPNPRCLCQAVCGNHHHIVRRFIQAGMKLDCIHYPSLAIKLLHPYAGRQKLDVDPYLLKGCSISYTTITPFAQAIRLGHQKQIQLFEDMGILETIMEQERFKAAIKAAAEAGNKKMISTLLKVALSVPELASSVLSDAVTIAALGNHEDIVELLMAAGGIPVASSLTSALLVHNARLVRLFLDAAVSIMNMRGFLYFAVRWGNTDVTEQLIDAGAPINQFGYELGILESDSVAPEKTRSPLMEAIECGNTKITRLLIEKGADISMTTHSWERSPLTVAIECGNESFARELLALGADPNDPEALEAAVAKSTEMTSAVLGAFCRRYPAGDQYFAAPALRLAIRDKNEIIIRLLANHANLNDTAWRKRDRDAGYVPIVQRLGQSHGYLPSLLGEGIVSRSVNIVRILLDSGGDPNSTVATMLPYSRRGRWNAVSEAIFTGDVDMVKLLHDAGADLHFSATLGLTHTSLQLAIDLGHFSIVQYLLEQGVNLAASNGLVGIAEMLVQHGADINALCSKYEGRTAFEGAAEHGRIDMLLFLFHNGVDIISDGGKQIQRAGELAKSNGQLAANSLVEKLAETARLNAILEL
ncbi:hypothetical protein AG0111_0g4192 [Alternaria gaisen]|uniref:Uncharacterized protein n=1 Tax=Alternaria gaisen TaxID=167740 RepID=A0ACB6FS38_9PLEO|nr:hypothetical protein AG0111_0g4192 [Alternaria gaisen]